MMQVIPGWTVTWTVAIYNAATGYIEQTESETTMRVPNDHLVAFIETLRYNNVEKFYVERSQF